MRLAPRVFASSPPSRRPARVNARFSHANVACANGRTRSPALKRRGGEEGTGVGDACVRVSVADAEHAASREVVARGRAFETGSGEGNTHVLPASIVSCVVRDIPDAARSLGAHRALLWRRDWTRCRGQSVGTQLFSSRARMVPCPVCKFSACSSQIRVTRLSKTNFFLPRVPSSGRSPSAAERRHHVDAGRRRPPDGRVDARRDRIGRRCVFGPPEMPHARASRPVPSLERALRSKIALCFCHTRIARSRHTEQPLTHSLRASSHHLNRRRRRCGADDSRAHGPALVRAAPVTPAQPPEPPRALGAADAGARVRGWLPGPGALAADGHAHGLPPGPVLPPGEADARPRASHAGLVQRYDGRDDGRGAISRRSVNNERII